MKKITIVIMNNEAIRIIEEMQEKHMILIVSTSEPHSALSSDETYIGSEFSYLTQPGDNGPANAKDTTIPKTKWVKKKKKY